MEMSSQPHSPPQEIFGEDENLLSLINSSGKRQGNATGQ
jgi:hypothetical protein